MMGKNEAQAPTLPRVRYMCFDLTHAPVATAARAATLNRSFFPTTSAVPPVSFPIIHPREIQIMWSQ